MNLKKAAVYGLMIIVIEALLFWIVIFGGRPDPSVAIGVVVIVPFLFVLNLILGLFLYFRKLRQVAGLMFLNSILAPLIFYLIWIYWYHQHATNNYAGYVFTVAAHNYEIFLSKDSHEFSIDDQENDAELFYGKFEMSNDTIKLETSKNKMFIIDETLYNFPLDSNAIKLQVRQ